MNRLLVTRAFDRPASAYFVWKTLREAGYECLFAGGWVRDLWMSRPSDDVDLATSATPQEVMALFARCLPLGQRFGSVVVLVQDPTTQEKKIDPIEVTTFRRDGEYIDGRRPSEIHPGTPLEDARRRDFTINGLFFDPQTEEILDGVDGLQDIDEGLVRAIGNPRERFGEDRLRLLRAVRFAARFGFSFDSLTLEAICEYAPSILEGVSPERIWQEFTKMHQGGHLIDSLHIMNACGLLQAILGLSFPLDQLLVKLAPVSEQGVDIGLVRTLAHLWAKGPDKHALAPCQLKLQGLHLSNADKKRLERLAQGLDLYARDRDLLDRASWLNWLKDAESHLDSLWMSQVLGDLAWSLALGKLYRHPLLELMKKEGALMRAHHLSTYALAPGRALGELLNWLNQEAAQLLTCDRSRLLAHMICHPQGLKLLRQAARK